MDPQALIGLNPWVRGRFVSVRQVEYLHLVSLSDERPGQVRDMEFDAPDAIRQKKG
jgi:hypothetical protein